jgi:amicoumacin kinase
VDPKIAARYNDDILRQAMGRFGIQKDQIELLDGFESFIYRFRGQGVDEQGVDEQGTDSQGTDEFILRIGHSGRRTPQLVAGEVDWLNYLARGGARVCPAVLSAAGNLVEMIDDGHGQQFLATAFVKASGVASSKVEWSSTFVRHYGQVIGRLHALTKEYVPADPSWRRNEWDATANLDMDLWMPAAEKTARLKFDQLMCHLTKLPRDRDSYGLIHQDAHGGNFFVDQGQITLFDFDDCVYGFFVYDIAMVLFYAAMFKKDPAAYAADFMVDFLRGYSQENRLDPVWLKEFPYFMKLREIDLYAVLHFSFDLENEDDPWVRGFMAGRKQRIDEGVPYIDFDWESLTEYLGLEK